jgi:hypothetical protein
MMTILIVISVLLNVALLFVCYQFWDYLRALETARVASADHKEEAIRSLSVALQHWEFCGADSAADSIK